MYSVFAGADLENHIESLNLEKYSHLEAFDKITEAGVHYYHELHQKVISTKVWFQSN